MTYYIPSKIVGVTFENEDKTKRQDIIRNLMLSDKLFLEKEDNNPYDANSIVVKTNTNLIVGHISKELAKELRDKEKSGETILGISEWKPTGLDDPKKTLGINIMIVMKPKEPEKNEKEQLNENETTTPQKTPETP